MSYSEIKNFVWNLESKVSREFWNTIFARLRPSKCRPMRPAPFPGTRLATPLILQGMAWCAEDTVLRTGAYSQSMHACEENSKQVQEKFTEKMKQNNVRHGGRIHDWNKIETKLKQNGNETEIKRCCISGVANLKENTETKNAKAAVKRFIYLFITLYTECMTHYTITQLHTKHKHIIK